jgi:hypothetical protein
MVSRLRNGLRVFRRSGGQSGRWTQVILRGQGGDAGVYRHHRKKLEPGIVYSDSHSAVIFPDTPSTTSLHLRPAPQPFSSAATRGNLIGVLRLKCKDDQPFIRVPSEPKFQKGYKILIDAWTLQCDLTRSAAHTVHLVNDDIDYEICEEGSQGGEDDEDGSNKQVGSSTSCSPWNRSRSRRSRSRSSMGASSIISTSSSQSFSSPAVSSSRPPHPNFRPSRTTSDVN